MKAVNLGDRNLLDASMVLVTTELGDSNLHNFRDIACLVAGRAGGKLRAGQNLNLQDRSYNHLLISLIHAAGVANPTFGDPMLGTGPLTEILG